MGLQGLGARNVRRIEAAIGEPVVRAVVNNGYNHAWWGFTTADHRHGVYDRYTEEVEWYVPRRNGCTTLCRQLFPADWDLDYRIKVIEARVAQALRRMN